MLLELLPLMLSDRRRNVESQGFQHGVRQFGQKAVQLSSENINR